MSTFNQDFFNKINQAALAINDYWGTPPVKLFSELTEEQKFEFVAKKNFCQACSNQKHGVKSRKSKPHTCGLNQK